jgi:chloramphenicol-sensitive protein RarD
VSDRPRGDSIGGILYALAACGFWGFVPLYFHVIRSVSVWEILAHRIVWGLVLVAAVVTARRRWAELGGYLRSGRVFLLLLATAGLLGVNWCVFIYGVTAGRVVDVSLGYFINPLVSVLLGMVFLKERLRPAQWLALALAAGGIGYLVVASGLIPWVGLVVACCFGIYGLLRKYIPADGLLALTAEMLVLLPFALAGLAYWTFTGKGAFGGDPTLTALLLFSGVVTAFPLFCFGEAVRRVRLSTLGFLQYLGPTLQFLLAVGVLGERFGTVRQVSFGLIWLALIVFSLDSLLTLREARPSTFPEAGPSEEALPAEGLPGPSAQAADGSRAAARC